MKQSIIALVSIMLLFISCKSTNEKEMKSEISKTEVPKVFTTQVPEVFATTDQAVGNITYTHTGELVYSHHPFFAPENRVMIMNTVTKESTPFPNKKWNTPRENDDQYLSNVLGVRNDKNGVVWMIDMAQRNAIKPKIVGWNTKTNQLEKIYYIDEATVKTSQPNDMVVDTKHGVFIIADEGIGNGGDGSTGAFITVDMKTGETRRLLEGHRTTLPENTPTIINGKHLAVNGTDLLVGNDGITSDKDFEWIYYGPLNGTKIYRIKTIDLLNQDLTEAELDRKIETYSEKPNNGGMSMDMAGNIYLTALETNSVSVVLSKDKSVKTMVQDEKMVWPDGVSYNNADGYMYVSAAQVNRGAVFNNGKSTATKPFYIFRFKPITAGVPFR